MERHYEGICAKNDKEMEESSDAESSSDSESDMEMDDSGSESDGSYMEYTESIDPWEYMIHQIIDSDPADRWQALKEQLWRMTTLMYELRKDPTFRKIKTVQTKLMEDDYDFDESLRKSIQDREFLILRKLKQYLDNNDDHDDTDDDSEEDNVDHG